ncbi:Peroxin-3 [Achaetomium macrosporum]|uniref:Peroxin-3 n=1 Tax=Achaetomium macrosporum TaxID=79813 RepID=A0AAN7CDI6_9PEZI|nr:Peroxin-3 [Achaetomium macrosporum]
MLAATRRWFRRNRTPIAIGLGVIGAGYIATSYVLGKLRDARERMSSDRIAKENLRRRFEQNQEDCTFTVLALLPTATNNILEAMNTEKISLEIQQMKGSTAARTRSIGSTSPPTMSEANATDDDGRSIITVSAQSEAGMHTTQLSVATPLPTAGPDSGTPGTPQQTLSTPSKPRKTKRQLWDDLTISSITRAYTLLYTLGLLTMLTRVQLNLLGRRSYLSSVVSLATGGAAGTISLENNDDDSPEQAYGTDFDVNRKYLTFSWWLLNRGWVDVMQRVEHAVRQVFGHLSPRDTLTLDTFSKLTRDVRSLVEANSASSGGAPGTAWLPFLLPPPDMEESVLRESGVLDSVPSGNPTPTTTHTTPPSSPTSAASLRRLLDETSDLIESPAFSHVLTQLLDAGFSVLLDEKLVQGVFDTPASSLDPLGGAGLSSSRAVLLPKILSVLARQAHAIGNGMPNEYLQAMESVRDLEGFAAVVYSSNWQAEIAGDDDVVVEERQQQQQQQQQQGEGEGQRPRHGGEVVEESMVMVDIPPPAEGTNDPQASLFDSVWEKASAGK